MSFKYQLRHGYQALLRGPLKLLTRITRIPEDPVAAFDLDPALPVYYVLRTRSDSNFLALQRQTRQVRMPEARMLEMHGDQVIRGSCLFLQKRKGWWDRSNKLPRHDRALETLLELQRRHPETPVQLVPVSVFWGRNPGKENSFLRLLFTDIEEAGRFWKAIIILLQGRQCFVQFGRPVELDSVIREGVTAPTAAHKLSRILRVHFSRQWTAAMGPSTSTRRELARGIVASDPVQEAIRREARTAKISEAKARDRARAYVREIAADYKYTTVRWLSFLLTRLWTRIYNGVHVDHIDQVRDLAKDHEIIYVPCHRSHIDYLLLSYLLYYEGLVPPHIAAGINLNFWPVGGVLRKGGAFFLRRSFSGNKLYTAVFNEYLYRLFNKGISVEFFPEGGRSRTGRLLPPKTGMLAMTLQSMLRGVKRPIAFVPVYIGYERLFEGKSYLNELRGKSKQQESMGQLLGVRKALKRDFGQVYVNFGEPVRLADYLDTAEPGWREDFASDDLKPAWLPGQVDSIASLINQRINAAACLNAISLVSLILLGTPKRALTRRELVAQLDTCLKLARKAPFSGQVYVPAGSGEQLLGEAFKLGMVSQARDPMGDIVFIEGDEAILMTYYSNNILHLFALPSIMACCFERNECCTAAQLAERIEPLYPLLRAELYLHWHREQLAGRITELAVAMADDGLLERIDDKYCRPDGNSEAWGRLVLLGKAMQPALQRYAITFALLQSRGQERVHRAELERDSQRLAERISALYGINAPEFSDKTLFRSVTRVLKEEGLAIHEEGKGMVATEALARLHGNVLDMLNLNVRQELHHVVEERNAQVKVSESPGE